MIKEINPMEYDIGPPGICGLHRPGGGSQYSAMSQMSRGADYDVGARSDFSSILDPKCELAFGTP